MPLSLTLCMYNFRNWENEAAELISVSIDVTSVRDALVDFWECDAVWHHRRNDTGRQRPGRQWYQANAMIHFGWPVQTTPERMTVFLLPRSVDVLALLCIYGQTGSAWRIIIINIVHMTYLKSALNHIQKYKCLFDWLLNNIPQKLHICFLVSSYSLSEDTHLSFSK